MNQNNGARLEGDGGHQPISADDDGHVSGQWPKSCRRTFEADQAWQALQAQRVRRETTLDALRSDLEEQPNSRAVRAAGRRWAQRVTTMADEIATRLEGAS